MSSTCMKTINSTCDGVPNGGHMPTFLFVALYDEYALGLRLFVNILRAAGYEARILMFKEFDTGQRHPPTETEWSLLKQVIMRLRPDFVGISSTSLHIIDEQRLFSITHEAAPEAVVMSGGFGPTFEPERFLNYGSDFVVMGEGEMPILEIAKCMTEKGELKKIRNLAWLEDDRLVLNPLHPQIDLGKLPYPYYGDDNIIYIDKDAIQSIDPMLTLKGIYMTNTSRGCTSHCSYCSGGNWHNLYKTEQGKCARYRSRPVESVISECALAKEMGARYILFMDEHFVRPEAEYFNFFEEYKRRVGLPFGLMVHTEFMRKDPARFEAFFQAGVHNVELGVQSGSAHILNDVFRRKISLQTQIKTIRQFYERWVMTQVDFITGHCMESEDDFNDTLDFVRELPFDPSWPQRCHIAAFPLALLPGAPVRDMFPEIAERPMDQAEKEFRLRILFIRHILKDEKAFRDIYGNAYLRRKPDSLKYLFLSIFARLNSRFWQTTLERLKGREVYFFGAGQCYQMYKHMFKDTRPLAILLDRNDDGSCIDGIRVEAPDGALAVGGQVPVVIFSWTPGVIATRIMRDFPAYSDLIACHYAQYPQYFL